MKDVSGGALGPGQRGGHVSAGDRRHSRHEWKSRVTGNAGFLSTGVLAVGRSAL